MSSAHWDELFTTYLRPFTGPNVHFYLGGAVGIDTLALQWLAQYTDVAVTVVVPSTTAKQPAAAQEAIAIWERSGRLFQIVELGAPTLSAVAYHARNRWMVDHSNFVIGFPHDNDAASGTWYTLNYAAEQGKPRLVVPI